MWKLLKKQKWIILFLTIGTIWWGFHTIRPEVIYNASYAYNRIADEYILIDSFEQTIFANNENSELSAGRLRKWTGPIKYALEEYPAESQKEIAINVANLFMKLTGLKIHKTRSSKTGSNFNIHFGENSELPKFSAKYSFDYSKEKKKFDGVLCLSESESSERGAIYFAANYIATDLEDDEEITSCQLEEFAHAFGFGHGTLYTPSVVGELSKSQQLSINDKIMVRTLYDYRLRPGMTRDEAMPIARKIIAELVAAVKRRGEQALYQ